MKLRLLALVFIIVSLILPMVSFPGVALAGNETDIGGNKTEVGNITPTPTPIPTPIPIVPVLAKSDVYMTKTYPILTFEGAPDAFGSLYHKFGLDGTIEVWDTSGNKITLSLPSITTSKVSSKFPTYKLYSEGSKVWYEYKATVDTKAADASFQIVFDFASKTNGVEVILKGTMPESGKVAFPITTLREKVSETYRISSVTKNDKGEITSSVGFDWADAPVECSKSVDATSVDFAVSTNFNIDPTTVGTSTTTSATYESTQRKTFYYNGRDWVFYSDGTNLVYRTSNDWGASWSAATVVTTCASGLFFDIEFDGTYAHYAFADNIGTNYVHYRRFIPNADGTVTYSAAQQNVVTSSYSFFGASITTSSAGGTPYISYFLYNEATTSMEVRLTKSSTTDGTWSTAAGFPKDIRLPDASGSSQVVSSAAGKVIVIYTDAATTILLSRTWDGSTLLGERTISSDNALYMAISAVAEGETIHLIHAAQGGWFYPIMYSTYTMASDLWAAETTISATGHYFGAGLCIDPSGNLYAFYTKWDDKIYYKKQTADVWAAEVEFVSEANLDERSLTVSAYATSSVVDVIFVSGAGSPYNVRHAYLAPATVPSITTNAVTNIGNISAQLNGQVTATGGAALDWVGFDYDLDSGAPYSFSTTTAGSYGICSFNTTSLIFSKGTTYYLRAKGHNVEGTGYGAEVSFTTLKTIPTIQTLAATLISKTTARLNSYITDNGGDSCQVRFEWDTDTGAPYAFNSGWLVGNYTSGYPYTIAASLNADDTYYFRVDIRGAMGNSTGSELTFITTAAISPPGVLSAIPRSGETVSLLWNPGEGSSQTLVRYKVGGPPTTTADGLLAYMGTDTSYMLRGLTPGTTYGLRAWGYDAGAYSSANITEYVTTEPAGFNATALDQPDEPTGFFQTPSYTKLENLPIYDLFNGVADQLGIPRAAFWMFFGSFIPIILGVIVYRGTHSSMLAITFVLFGILGGWNAGAFPGWFAGVFVMLGGGLGILMGVQEGN